MVSASGTAASNFAHGYAVASNLAKHELWTVKKVITRIEDIKKNASNKLFQFFVYNLTELPVVRDRYFSACFNLPFNRSFVEFAAFALTF